MGRLCLPYIIGYIMETNEKTALVEALQTGLVTVTFNKVGTGEMRIMSCTLNPDVMKEHGVDIDSSNDNAPDPIPVLSLDKDGWRSFRMDSVVKWDINGGGSE